MNHWVLETADAFEHGVDDLGVQADGALLELMKRRIVGTVDTDELLLQALQLRLILGASRGLYQGLKFLVQLIQIVLSSFDVFLCFKQEQILFLIMVFHCLG